MRFSSRRSWIRGSYRRSTECIKIQFDGRKVGFTRGRKVRFTRGRSRGTFARAVTISSAPGSILTSQSIVAKGMERLELRGGLPGRVPDNIEGRIVSAEGPSLSVFARSPPSKEMREPPKDFSGSYDLLYRQLQRVEVSRVCKVVIGSVI